MFIMYMYSVLFILYMEYFLFALCRIAQIQKYTILVKFSKELRLSLYLHILMCRNKDMLLKSRTEIK